MSDYFNRLIASSYLLHGDVIAYPTEAVFGIGCLPNNESALKKVIDVKARDINKGMILISHDLSYLKKYVNFKEISLAEMKYMEQFWPGPYTFILPALPDVSFYITGNHSTIAVRISSHPLIKSLCEVVGEPLISTSANKSKEAPCKTYRETICRLGNLVDYVVEGCTLGYLNPSAIIDLKSKTVIRKG